MLVGLLSKVCRGPANVIRDTSQYMLLVVAPMSMCWCFCFGLFESLNWWAVFFPDSRGNGASEITEGMMMKRLPFLPVHVSIGT